MTLLILTILIVIFALAFDFINGFHDTANAIATSVSTKALKPRHAIILAAVMNFVGAHDLYRCCQNHYERYCRSIYTTKWITSNFSCFNCSDCLELNYLVLSEFQVVLRMPLLVQLLVLPLLQQDFESLNYSGFIKIIQALIISPILAFAVGYIVYSIFKVVFKNNNLTKTNKSFRIFQIFTAALQAYTHGTNDAQKAMGIITMALIAEWPTYFTDIPFWVQFACADRNGTWNICWWLENH